MDGKEPRADTHGNGGTAARRLAADIRRRREAAGLSHARLAQILGYSRQYVAIAEQPAKGLPSAALVEALDNTLQAGGAFIAARADALRERLRMRAGSNDSVQPHAQARRPLVSSPLPPVTTPVENMGNASANEDIIDVLRRSHHLSRRVDPQVIRQLGDAVRATIEDYEKLDHAAILPGLLKQRLWIDELLGECQDLRQRQALYASGAATAGLLGHLATGRSNFPLARAYGTEALQLGCVAEDDDLQAWVRGLQSLCEYYAGDYVAALELARSGLGYAGSGPQTVRLLVNGVARAMGKLGDRDGVDRIIDQALTLLADRDAPGGFPSSISLGYYSRAQAASNAATAYVSLGMAQEVDQYVAIALPDAMQSSSPWTRSLVLLDQATVSIATRSGDLDRAMELAMEAVDISSGHPIVAVRSRTLDFVDSARKRWGESRQLRAISDRAAER